MLRFFLQVSGVALVALTIWALTLVAWMLWRGGGTAPPAASLPAEGRTARVAAVLATDRLQLEAGEEVRLAGLKVPAPGDPFAEEGKQAARALVEGRDVRLVGEGQVAVYLPDGTLLQTLLLSGGYARLEAATVPEALAAPLAEAEQQAREADLGVWRGAPVGTVPPSTDSVLCDATLVPGQTLNPQDTATHIGEVWNVVFLPPRAETSNGAVTLLAGVEAGGFGVVIPAGLASTAQDDLMGRYLNRCLVATGRLERGVGGGPRIVLRSFEQLIPLR